MSWFARSIANTLNLNQEEEEEAPRGVKDDLSELTHSLTRHFWGVASLLSSHHDEDDDVTTAGIRSDLSELGGKLKSGISKISETINVSDLTRMASDFISFAADNQEEGVGVAEELVEFVKELAMRPENWMDFPLPQEEDDGDGSVTTTTNLLKDGFDMTDAQQEHTLAVESLVPSLAALRMELCPQYMSESCFWMIYFVLLYPELGEEDAVIVSTPQIMDYRATLVSQLQNECEENVDKAGKVDVDVTDISTAQHEGSLLVTSSALSEYAPEKSFEADIQIVEESAISSAAADCASEKHAMASTSSHIVDKSVIEVKDADHNKNQSVNSSPTNSWENKDDDEDDVDDWLKEETDEIGRASGTTVPIENDEDVSFSDFEDEDEDTISNLKKVNYNSDKDLREWVKL